MRTLPRTSGPAPARAVALLALLVGLAPGCIEQPADADASKKDEESPEDAPVLVRTVQVGEGDLSRGLRATATLESERRAQLSLQASGLVSEVSVDVGMPVTAGQLLVTLDARQLDLARREAELAMNESAERTRELDLAVLEASQRLEQSKLEEEEALAAHARQRKLAYDDLVREDAVETARYTAEKATLAVKNAQIAVGKAAITAANARTAVRKAQLAYERAMIDWYNGRLYAPFDGVIASRSVRPGEQVSAGQVVFELADPRALRAPVFLPQKHIGRLSEGMRIEVTANGRVAPGSVLRLPRTVDPATGNVRLEVSVDEPDGFLPGMFVSLLIVTDRREGVPVVPKKAVRLDGEGAIVYRVDRVDDADVAHEVHFMPGLEDSDNVEVTGGVLAAGDRIVLIGVEQLSDGSKVQEAGAPAIGGAAGGGSSDAGADHGETSAHDGADG